MDSQTYYDKYNWEQANLAAKVKEKLSIIFDIIPKGVNTLLDVGCGDGAISDKLAQKYKVVSLDRSFNAVKSVSKNKIQASSSYLPFPDNSFDLVFSSELIEHLPDAVFSDTLKEMDRVTKKYILLTFPNDENIEKQLVRCPKCEYIFNKTFHLQSINKERIEKFFADYRIINSFETGAEIRDYNKYINKVKHSLSPADSWIPLFWTKNFHRNTMCPNCENEFEIPYKFNLIARACDLINIIISPKRKYQLGILLEHR